MLYLFSEYVIENIYLKQYTEYIFSIIQERSHAENVVKL